MKFNDFSIKKEILEKIKKAKFTDLTKTQEVCLGNVLDGDDVLCLGKTGTGKTLIFTIGILNKIEKNSKIGALILCPTRELSIQVSDYIRQFNPYGLRVFCAHGGVNIKEHEKKISGSEILVGTPGRIIDLLDRGAISLKSISIFVMDEFDLMLDLGFKKSILYISDKIRSKRQNLFFSATFSDDAKKHIRKISEKFLIKGEEKLIEFEKLKQFHYNCNSSEKFSILVNLLKKDSPRSAIIFCSTKLSCEIVGRNLFREGIVIDIIHGDVEQKKRVNVIKNLNKNGGIIVATDIASRGLDIDSVDVIYNYDLPLSTKEYIHRIGRSARGKRNGVVRTILSARDHKRFNKIIELGVISKLEKIDNLEDIKLELDISKLKKRVGKIRKKVIKNKKKKKKKVSKYMPAKGKKRKRKK